MALLKYLNCITSVMLVSMVAASQDTVTNRKFLYEQQFLSIVRSYHPIMKQAQITVEKAKASLLMARSGFDPALYYNNSQKTFDGRNYYQYVNPELKIPTWFGIEVKAGTENNNGLNTDTELSPGQSSYVGITVPLAKNLLMDKRRAALKQSKQMLIMSESERVLAINNLLYEAGSAYWNWVRAFLTVNVLDEMLTLSRERFRLVKTGFYQGDRPALDTTEALAQLQQFEYMKADATVSWQVAGQELSNFLWDANGGFYQLDSLTFPGIRLQELGITDPAFPALADLSGISALNHPQLKMYEQKLNILGIERKLKFQDLLPKVDVSANLLNKGYNVFNKIGGNFYEYNNKFNISVGLPLRFSEGRGGYRLAGYKIKETVLDRDMKKQSILNKLNASYSEMAGLAGQVEVYEKAVQNFGKLARGESQRFQAGESTLFLVNVRENKFLESQQKLIELKTKYHKSKLSVLWAAGVLR